MNEPQRVVIENTAKKYKGAKLTIACLAFLAFILAAGGGEGSGAILFAAFVILPIAWMCVSVAAWWDHG